MRKGIHVELCDQLDGFGRRTEVAVFNLTAHTENKEERDAFKKALEEALSKAGYEVRNVPWM